jgi:hypothetical protein
MNCHFSLKTLLLFGVFRSPRWQRHFRLRAAVPCSQGDRSRTLAARQGGHRAF